MIVVVVVEGQHPVYSLENLLIFSVLAVTVIIIIVLLWTYFFWIVSVCVCIGSCLHTLCNSEQRKEQRKPYQKLSKSSKWKGWKMHVFPFTIFILLPVLNWTDNYPLESGAQCIYEIWKGYILKVWCVFVIRYYVISGVIHFTYTCLCVCVLCGCELWMKMNRDKWSWMKMSGIWRSNEFLH